MSEPENEDSASVITYQTIIITVIPGLRPLCDTGGTRWGADPGRSREYVLPATTGIMLEQKSS